MNLGEQSEASVKRMTTTRTFFVSLRSRQNQVHQINRIFKIKMAIVGATVLIAVLIAALILNEYSSHASPVVDLKEEKALVQAWEQHIFEVKLLNTCGKPQPRLIKISEEFSDTGKWYVPSCALLHRCEPGVGCCEDENADCGPETTEQVFIPIQVIEADGGQIKIEELEFTNHTKCGCVEHQR